MIIWLFFKVLDFTFRIFWKNRNVCVLVFYYEVFGAQHENKAFFSCYTSIWTFLRKYDNWLFLKVLDFNFAFLRNFWKNRNLCVLVFYYKLFWGQHENKAFFSCYTSILNFLWKFDNWLFLKVLDFTFSIFMKFLKKIKMCVC